jgi:hypothetical protein
MAFGGHLMRCKSAVFWQTERLLGIFSTGTENNDFKRLFKWLVRIEERIGTRIGLIFPKRSVPHISGISGRDE